MAAESAHIGREGAIRLPASLVSAWGSLVVETVFVEKAGRVGVERGEACEALAVVCGARGGETSLPAGVPEALLGATWLELAQRELQGGGKGKGRERRGVGGLEEEEAAAGKNVEDAVRVLVEYLRGCGEYDGVRCVMEFADALEERPADALGEVEEEVEDKLEGEPLFRVALRKLRALSKVEKRVLEARAEAEKRVLEARKRVLEVKLWISKVAKNVFVRSCILSWDQYDGAFPVEMLALVALVFCEDVSPGPSGRSPAVYTSSAGSSVKVPNLSKVKAGAFKGGRDEMLLTRIGAKDTLVSELEAAVLGAVGGGRTQVVCLSGQGKGMRQHRCLPGLVVGVKTWSRSFSVWSCGM